MGTTRSTACAFKCSKKAGYIYHCWPWCHALLKRSWCWSQTLLHLPPLSWPACCLRLQCTSSSLQTDGKTKQNKTLSALKRTHLCRLAIILNTHVLTNKNTKQQHKTKGINRVTDSQNWNCSGVMLGTFLTDRMDQIYRFFKSIEIQFWGELNKMHYTANWLWNEITALH